MTMRSLYIGLGSNLGNRVKNLEFGLKQIGKTVGRVAAVSSLYESKPQPKYINHL